MTGGGPPPPPLSENEKMQFVSHFIMKQRLLIIKGKWNDEVGQFKRQIVFPPKITIPSKYCIMVLT